MNEQTKIKLRETRRQMMADLESSMLKGNLQRIASSTIILQRSYYCQCQEEMCNVCMTNYRLSIA